jgi:hypothetical protein
VSFSLHVTINNYKEEEEVLLDWMSNDDDTGDTPTMNPKAQSQGGLTPMTNDS